MLINLLFYGPVTSLSCTTTSWEYSPSVIRPEVAWLGSYIDSAGARFNGFGYNFAGTIWFVLSLLPLSCLAWEGLVRELHGFKRRPFRADFAD